MAMKEFSVGDRAVITPRLRSFPIGTVVTVVGQTEVWGIDSMIPNLLVVKEGSDFQFNINADHLVPHEWWGTRVRWVGEN